MVELSPGFCARYSLLGKIGEGAWGAVYRAHQRNLNREVAIKFFKISNRSNEPSALRRFEQEARLLARVHHPKVLRLFDFGVDEGYLFIVTELVLGRCLREQMESGHGLPVPRAVRIAIDVLHALDHVHGLGVLHRDVKPENVLVTPAGEVRLADFGLALMQESDERLTQPGDIPGTPRYLSPEALEGRSLGPQTDIYAVGTMLFEMLARRPPYTALTPVMLATQKIMRDAPRLSSIIPAFSPDLCALVARALERDPARRHGTAADLALDLEACLDGREPQRDRHATPARPRKTASPRRIAAPPPGRRLLAGWALALIVGIGVLVDVLWTRAYGTLAPRAPVAAASSAERGSSSHAHAADALTRALDAFAARSRLAALARAWTTAGLQTRPALTAQSIRQLEATRDTLEAQGWAIGLPDRLGEFHAALLRRGRDPVPVRAGDLELYRRLHDLVDLDVFLRSVSDGRVSLCAPLAGALPESWYPRSGPALAAGRAFSLKCRGAQDFPAHLIGPGAPAPDPGWSEDRFWSSGYRLVNALWFDRAAHDDLSMVEVLRESLLAPPLDYEHPAEFDVPAGVDAVEVGALVRESTPATQLGVRLRLPGRGWEDFALMRGAGGFLAIDPALVAGSRVALGVRFGAVRGTTVEFGASLRWVTVRWRTRS